MFNIKNNKIKIVCHDTSDCNLNTLHKEEFEIIKNIKSSLVKERFIAGRYAAHLALKALNFNMPWPILRSENGAPIWPNGIVGSISHSHQLGVAALAKSDYLRSIGVDLEYRKREINSGISKKVLLPSEEQWANSIPEKFKERLLIIFSAKEAIYKALSPIGAPIFWFHEVLLEVTNSNEETFKFKSTLSDSLLAICNLSAAPIVEVYLSDAYILSLCTIECK